MTIRFNILKSILGLYQSIRLSYVGRYGGIIDGGTYYLWWPIQVKNINAQFLNMHVIRMRNLQYTFNCSYGACNVPVNVHFKNIGEK
jgi:hypothetical protein